MGGTRNASETRDAKRWVRNVRTVSTFPPEGLFTKDAQTIARTMASKRVSPKGIGSGIRMIQFFINRAGRNLPPERRRELEKAKRILQERQRAQQERKRAQQERQRAQQERQRAREGRHRTRRAPGRAQRAPSRV